MMKTASSLFSKVFATVAAGYLSKTKPKNLLENFIFTLLISLTIETLTVYAGWTYAQIELWLANGFLTWYIWKLSTILVKIIAKKRNLHTASSRTTNSLDWYFPFSNPFFLLHIFRVSKVRIYPEVQTINRLSGF